MGCWLHNTNEKNKKDQSSKYVTNAPGEQYALDEARYLPAVCVVQVKI
jgi:hypothetical protein